MQQVLDKTKKKNKMIIIIISHINVYNTHIGTEAQSRNVNLEEKKGKAAEIFRVIILGQL